ncbi:MAG: hypothetical protein KGN33_13900 [Paracoccaceae bacterium]|nr:hypothetical protein [Paracoccaceae bacterium]
MQPVQPLAGTPAGGRLVDPLIPVPVVLDVVLEVELVVDPDEVEAGWSGFVPPQALSARRIAKKIPDLHHAPTLMFSATLIWMGPKVNWQAPASLNMWP